jgi:Rad3-related DNA helicase
MRALYTCLEEGKVAVFESPTGKLSFTCHLITPTNDVAQARYVKVTIRPRAETEFLFAIL